MLTKLKSLSNLSKSHFMTLSQAANLTSEQVEIQNMATDFAKQKILPFASEWDQKHHFPYEVVKESAQYGFGGIYTSPDYGGCGLGRMEAALVFQSLSTACVATSAYISIHNMNCWVIDQYGNEEQKQQYLNKMTQFDLFSSYCLTEPNSGSDAAAMKTVAKKEGDDYVINGSKIFISNAGVSDVYILMCKTAEKEISCILVEKDTKGLTFGKREEKMGWRSSPTCMVNFDDVRVPQKNLIGQEGIGFKIAMKALDGGRINIASTSLGAATHCLEQTIEYMKTRKQFGKKLSDFQHLAFKISEMSTRLVACQLMIQNAANMLDQDNANKTMYCAMAKQHVTDECFKIIDDCLQMFGGYGYLSEYEIERYLRDVRVNRILEGTNEVMKLIISRNILKD